MPCGITLSSNWSILRLLLYYMIVFPHFIVILGSLKECAGIRMRQFVQFKCCLYAATSVEGT